MKATKGGVMLRPRCFASAARLFYVCSLACMLSGIVSGCISQRIDSGYTFLQKEISDEALKGMTRREVYIALGSPSVRSKLDEEKWYYVANTAKRMSIFARSLESQTVLELSFNEEGKVSNVRRYNEKDSKAVAFSTDETPTSGHSVGILEQIFGNIGRFSTEAPVK